MFIFDKIIIDIIYTLILLNESLTYNKTKMKVIWKNFFRENFKLMFKPNIFIKNQSLPKIVYRNIFKKMNNKIHRFTAMRTNFFFYKELKFDYIQCNISKNFTWFLFKRENNKSYVKSFRPVGIFYTIQIICCVCLNKTYLNEVFDYSNLFFVNFIGKIISDQFYKNFITFNHFCIYCQYKRKMNRTVQIKCFDSNCLGMCHISSLFIIRPTFYVDSVVKKKNCFDNTFTVYENKMNFVLKHRLKIKTCTFFFFLIKISVFLKTNFFFLIKSISVSISRLITSLKQPKKMLKRFYFKKNTKISILELYGRYMNKFFFESCKKLDNYIDLYSL
nr:hypothetical protein CparaKRNrm2_p103 [Cryptomonas paramecium]